MSPTSRNPTTKALQLDGLTGSPFEREIRAACFSVAAAHNTRLAYWSDTRHWLLFCIERDVKPDKPAELAVIAWIEEMRANGLASKTRVRRISALSSVYDRLRRNKIVDVNPFSIETGPDREKAIVQAPTPIASPDIVRKVLATCDDSPIGRRDGAMLRILWSTGMRRSSLLSMTLEKLRRERTDFVATVTAKGNKEVRVLIRGKAADALTAWLVELDRGGITKGPIWRTSSGGTVTSRNFVRGLARRVRRAGVKGEKLSPHMLRVAFLTYNPAGLESKQDAAGHADPATTRLYDRRNWRGREAFEKMPEVDDFDGE